MAGRPVLWVAHNGRKFDVPFIIKEFQRCLVEIPADWMFVDTLPLARQLMKPDGRSLFYLFYFFYGKSLSSLKFVDCILMPMYIARFLISICTARYRWCTGPRASRHADRLLPSGTKSLPS